MLYKYLQVTWWLIKCAIGAKKTIAGYFLLCIMGDKWYPCLWMNLCSRYWSYCSFVGALYRRGKDREVVMNWAPTHQTSWVVSDRKLKLKFRSVIKCRMAIMQMIDLEGPLWIKWGLNKRYVPWLLVNRRAPRGLPIEPHLLVDEFHLFPLWTVPLNDQFTAITRGRNPSSPLSRLASYWWVGRDEGEVAVNNHRRHGPPAHVWIYIEVVINVAN